MSNKRPKSKSEIASEYGISINTFKKWIKPFIADLEAVNYNREAKILTPAQVDVIYEKLGKPND